MSDREGTSSSTSTGNHADAAEAFADRARTRFTDEPAGLCVFGSTARGEAHGLASDVDVLVALDDTANHEATADSLRDLAYDVMLEYGPVVELRILLETGFRRSRNGVPPSSETSSTRDDRASDATILRRMSRSRPTPAGREALSDAEGARDAELSDAVVINRLYRAGFHAAQAALHDRGHEPESHGGVLSLFGSEIVVAGDAPRDPLVFMWR